MSTTVRIVSTVSARISALACLWLLVAGTPANAQTLQDAAGTSDHPAVSRFKGSILLGSSVNPFESVVVALGPMKFDNAARRARAAKEETVEAQVTRHTYLAPAGTTALEVARNYEQALSSAGFKTLYRCGPADCGSPAPGSVYRNAMPSLSRYQGQAFFNARESFYMVARGGGGTAPMTVLVMVGEFTANRRAGHGQALVQQVILQPKDTSLGNVTADAKAMSGEIAQSGKATLYGLLFDTGSAVLKAESKPQLGEIAKLLQSNAKLNVIVVGHTDSQGSLDLNIKLSEQRAAAVVKALTSEYGVAPARLTARGAGMIAPVASNRSDAGRAKNRRVEIVER
jgi:OmpA-OmpF porin, OOP family